MEADLAPAPPLRATAHGIGVWALLGLLLGGLAPGVVAFMLGEPAGFAGFIVASEVGGLLTGALLGVLDLPRRLVGPTWRRAALAGLIALPLGALWAGLTGALGGAGFAGTFLLTDPNPFMSAQDVGGLVVALGAMLGLIVGTPAVVLFCVVRAITLDTGRPWWLAHLASVLITTLIAFPGFALVFGAPLTWL